MQEIHLENIRDYILENCPHLYNYIFTAIKEYRFDDRAEISIELRRFLREDIFKSILNDMEDPKVAIDIAEYALKRIKYYL